MKCTICGNEMENVTRELVDDYYYRCEYMCEDCGECLVRKEQD